MIPISSSENKQRSKVLFGGINDSEILRKGSVGQVQESLTKMLRETPQRVILAPGCVIPLDTPQDNIKAAVDSIRNFTVK